MDHQEYMNHVHQNQELYYSNVSSSSVINKSINNNNQQNSSGEEEDDEMGLTMDLRRGPWTAEEDHTLVSYIAKHGEGRWNSLARCAGLKRTGKSCRLRWLNYLRPNVRRGNITLEEQLRILELHSHWGNRWSKIAQHLPGRTDNEIKNYWRTRVQKHAKQLKCDVNSKQFKDTMRYLWMPRLVERIQAANGSSAQIPNTYTTHPIPNHHDVIIPPFATATLPSYVCSENSSTTGASSDSFNAQVSPFSDMTENHQISGSYNQNTDFIIGSSSQVDYSDSLISPAGYYHPQHVAGFYTMEQNNLGCTDNNPNQWVADGGDLADNTWNEDIWHLQHQQFNNNY